LTQKYEFVNLVPLNNLKFLKLKIGICRFGTSARTQDTLTEVYSGIPQYLQVDDRIPVPTLIYPEPLASVYFLIYSSLGIESGKEMTSQTPRLPPTIALHHDPFMH
jgi:hypothetical protein